MCWILTDIQINCSSHYPFLYDFSQCVCYIHYQEKGLGKAHLTVHTNLPKKMALNAKSNVLC